MQQLKEIPFFFKSHLRPGNGGFPEVMTFHLFFDKDLGMFRQQAYPQLEEILNKVYIEGSLADGSISSESGGVYVDKIVDYLFEHFSFTESTHVLEIGFGSGILLKKLKEREIKNLTGIEPGNHERVEGLEDILLVKDFFPSSQIQQKFDLIYMMLVLEHLEYPEKYLISVIEKVNKGGKVIFAIPDCTPYLQEGDISIFIHEHFSYFTCESVERLVSKTGFGIEDISVIEGALVVTISQVASPDPGSKEIVSFESFSYKVGKHIQKLQQLFAEYEAHEIAIYSPIRALNALYYCGKQACRLVDDSSELHGKYLPAMSSPIESFEDLKEKPPKCILIYSRTFGEKIKEKCKAEMKLGNTRLMTLNDMEMAGIV